MARLANNVAYGSGGTVTSSALPLQRNSVVGAVVVVSGNGNITFEVSHDNSVWYGIATAGINFTMPTTIAAGNRAYSLAIAGFRWFRVVYTNTSGAGGNITIDANGDPVRV